MKLTECHSNSDVVERIGCVAARAIVVDIDHLIVGRTPTEDAHEIATREEVISIASCWICVVNEDRTPN